MIVTHKMKVDLTRPEGKRTVEVMQDDRYSRNLQITLMANNTEFALPEDCSVVIRYAKADGTGGEYDTMPDGTKAWQVEGSTVTVRLAPQVCTVAGEVEVTVTMMAGQAVLSCFALYLRVQATSHGKLISQDYSNVTTISPSLKAELVAAVIEALPNAEEVSF